jgi:hypothetical protein
MRRMLLAAALLLTTSLGCRNESAMPARAPIVSEGDRDAVLQKLKTAMVSAGHDCKSVEKGRLLCVTKDTAHLRLFLVPVDSPIRAVVLVVAFKLKVPCPVAYPRMNKLNYDLDLVKTTCDEAGAFIASGGMPIPEAGLSGTDVTRFVEKWIGAFAVAFNAYGLVEVLE